MSLNLIELIGKQLGGETFGKLGSLIGQSPDSTKSAVGAAVPALLAGISSAASKPEGAAQLFSLVGKQDQGLLGSFEGIIGSQGNNLAQQGSNTITSLLGNNLLGGLMGALAKFTGMSQNAISTLLGALTPMVLGVLGKQIQSGGLNASGLAGLLESQKGNISAALPGGLGSLMGTVPGLSGLFSSAGSATSAAASAAAGAAQTGAASLGRAAEATAGAGSNILKYLIPLALIILAVLWFRSRSTDPTPTPQPQPLNTKAEVTVAESLGVLDRLNQVFADATATLTTITDPASATAAIPKLQALGVNVDAVQGVWNQVPEATRPSIRAVSSAGVDKLKALIEKTLAIPGVGPQLKPVTDQLLVKLQAFQ